MLELDRYKGQLTRSGHPAELTFSGDCRAKSKSLVAPRLPRRVQRPAIKLAGQLVTEGVKRARDTIRRAARRAWRIVTCRRHHGHENLALRYRRREKPPAIHILLRFKNALAPFEKIRSAVGDRMEMMVESHSVWQLLAAMQIAKELAPFKTFRHEDPVKMDSLATLKRYAEVSPAPVCASETSGSRWAFRDLLQTEAAGVVMLDLSWCGGLSEARRIWAMAEAWHLPLAPHDCTGPVVFMASTHLSLNANNALIQESGRAFYRGWYPEVMTAIPKIENGFVTVPGGPG